MWITHKNIVRALITKNLCSIICMMARPPEKTETTTIPFTLLPNNPNGNNKQTCITQNSLLLLLLLLSPYLFIKSKNDTKFVRFGCLWIFFFVFLFSSKSTIVTIVFRYCVSVTSTTQIHNSSISLQELVY